MIQAGVIVSIALAYVGVLFAVAYWGDKQARRRTASRSRPTIYALSLAVYCTSWTFFGSVGLAASTGYDFIPVYLGPILLFVFGWPLLLRIVRLAKSQNITSVADFLAARYGKSQAVAAIVTIIAVAGTLPYIALQLKAVALSVDDAARPRPLGQQSQLCRPTTRLHHRHDDGDLRRPVRHPPHRRDRAPGRPDPGDRGRIARQARRLPGRRLLRHLLHVRRHRRAASSKAAEQASRSSACSPAASMAALADGDVPRRRCASCCCRASSM